MIGGFWNCSGSRLSTGVILTSGKLHVSNLKCLFSGLFFLFIGFADVLNGFIFL